MGSFEFGSGLETRDSELLLDFPRFLANLSTYVRTREPRIETATPAGISADRRKVCYFCQNKIEHVSYRDTNLRNFRLGQGSNVPAKNSGNLSRHQRRLSRAIKQARYARRSTLRGAMKVILLEDVERVGNRPTS